MTCLVAFLLVPIIFAVLMLPLVPILVVMAWSGWGAPPLGSAPPRPPSLVRPDVSGGGCGLVLVGLSALFVGQFAWGVYVQTKTNAAIVAGTKQVEAALGAYSARHAGRYPARADLGAAMPGGRLPADPWSSSAAQLRVLAIEKVWIARRQDDPPWPGAEALVRGAPLPEVGDFREDVQHGVLVYDRTSDGRHYVLYGLGTHTYLVTPFTMAMPELVAAFSSVKPASRRPPP